MKNSHSSMILHSSEFPLVLPFFPLSSVMGVQPANCNVPGQKYLDFELLFQTIIYFYVEPLKLVRNRNLRTSCGYHNCNDQYSKCTNNG